MLGAEHVKIYNIPNFTAVTLTRALQGIFPNGQMYFWWMSIICFYDTLRTLAE